MGQAAPLLSWESPGHGEASLSSRVLLPAARAGTLDEQPRMIDLGCCLLTELSLRFLEPMLAAGEQPDTVTVTDRVCR